MGTGSTKRRHVTATLSAASGLFDLVPPAETWAGLCRAEPLAKGDRGATLDLAFCSQPDSD